ncbi:dna repair protein rad51 homolog 3 [Phaffia rhodozyma]|uniref:Dna repair protein rad51 homolog 3 n=1 Tax=Phaffia rhodozyma TaxID=264483 RepID=A0A0F7SH14_PHARH|nr:dna repair protein rad51 homolog 3 [Phaffia rhodozyma]
MKPNLLLSSLSFSPQTSGPLSRAGYLRIHDLQGIQPEDLAKDTGLTLTEAQDVIRTALGDPTPNDMLHQVSSQTASQLLDLSSRLPSYSFQSKSIDSLFPDGIKPGMIIEVSGPPGIGKTCALVGIVMDMRIKNLKEVEKHGEKARRREVLVVDTEASISPDRLAQAAENQATRESGQKLSSEDILEGIRLLRLHTLSQFVSFFKTLDTYLDEHPEIKSIVIDTLSYHLRSPSIPPDAGSRSRIVALIKQELQRCSTRYECTFVVSVQMATKFSDVGEGNLDEPLSRDERAFLMPQLGVSWIPMKTKRLMFFYGGGMVGHRQVKRFATIIPVLPPNSSHSAYPSSQNQNGNANGTNSGMWGNAQPSQKEIGLGSGIDRVEYRISSEGMLADI